MLKRSLRVIGLTAAVITALWTSAALAKDNTQHLAALGFQRHHGTGLQTHQAPLAGPDALLSAKFAVAPVVEVAALLGFTVTDGAFGITLGGKGLYIIIPEEHLNVYVAAAPLLTVGSLGLHRVDWFVGPGLAWYLPGAPNLEIFAEFGLGGTIPWTRETAPSVVAPSAVYASTTGTIVLGLHYWF